MTVQIVIAIVSVVVTAILTLPLWRGRKTVADRSEYDLAVYRQQLADVDADIARGAMTEDEAVAVRLEIERRMLRVARSAPGAMPAAAPRRVLAVLVMIAVPAASLALYHVQGRPDLPGLPFAERAPDQGPDRAKIAALLARIEKQLQVDPDNARGWQLLGQGYLSLGDTAKAAEVLKQAIEHFPNDADLKSAFGEALVLDSDGVVGPEALRIFRDVLAADPEQVAPRYYIALSDLQAGHAKQAYDEWRALAAGSPADAPWLGTIQKGLNEAARQLGTKPEDATKLAKAVTQSLPQPSKEAVDAAQSMTKEQRSQFIRSMVERLAARLKESPDDLDGWLRLGQSYTVLGEREKAADAYRQAMSLMKPDDSRRAAVEGRIAQLAKPADNESTDPPNR